MSVVLCCIREDWHLKSTFAPTHVDKSLNYVRLAPAVLYETAMATGEYTSTCTGTGTGVYTSMCTGTGTGMARDRYRC